jgi:hypothetical protein
MIGKTMIGKTRRVPMTACTSCGHPVDAATPVGSVDAAPSPGDATVCFHCGHVMIYADGLSLRDPTDAEMHELAGDPRIVVINNRLRARNNA